MNHGDLYREHLSRLSTEISAALGSCGYDSVILHAGREAKKSRFDDQYWSFIATPAFAHVVPLPEPNCAIELRAGDTFSLHRPAHESYWEAPPPEPKAWVLDPLGETSPDRKRSGKVAFVGNDELAASDWRIGEDAINPAALVSALDSIRAKKSAYEVECMARANRIATSGHAALIEAFIEGGHSEFELHLVYLAATNQDDAETPYKNIVAYNRNAAILHHIRYGREKIESTTAASLLIDAGALVNGYAADVTRTHVRSAGDSGASHFSDLIHAIDALQQEICRRLSPGVSFESLHDQTHELLAEAIVALEIATASPAELIEAGVTRALLPHGLGHSLGIQVHDVGCRTKLPAERNPFLRNTADVEVGQVFTIEPGCYFIESLLGPLRTASIGKSLNWPLIDELARFGGVRIEDNIHMADGETRNLTRDNWPSSP